MSGTLASLTQHIPKQFTVVPIILNHNEHLVVTSICSPQWAFVVLRQKVSVKHFPFRLPVCRRHMQNFTPAANNIIYLNPQRFHIFTPSQSRSCEQHWRLSTPTLTRTKLHNAHMQANMEVIKLFFGSRIRQALLRKRVGAIFEFNVHFPQREKGALYSFPSWKQRRLNRFCHKTSFLLNLHQLEASV